MKNYNDFTLDDWYKTINSIFIDRNYERHPAIIYSHLVEIVAGLSCLASKKNRPNVTVENYAPKAFAWWMALCGKMRIKSVEAMLFAKFPLVCPYCQSSPHKDLKCREFKRQHKNPDWDKLKIITKNNWNERPRTLRDWQIMFSEIYPTAQNEEFGSIFSRLNEEIGELSEAVRAYDLAPGLFFSEAPDVFAWLMKIVNKMEEENSDAERGQKLTQFFSNTYPDSCSDCGCSICRCPSILPSTLGRIAGEVPTTIDFRESQGAILTIMETQALFEKGANELRYKGQVVKVDGTTVQQIHVAVHELLKLSDTNNKRIIESSVGVIDALISIQELTQTQRVTNESLQELASALANLPSEKRSVAMSFLTNIAAAPWSQLLVNMVNDFSARLVVKVFQP